MEIKYFFYLILLVSIIKECSNLCFQGYNCPNNSGVCKADICECLPGYQTLIIYDTNPIFCDYKQFSKWYPFILELFFPSIGLFLIGRFFHGFIKLALFLPIILGNIKVPEDWIFLFGLMYFVDLVLIYFKIYKDGNGIPLA